MSEAEPSPEPRPTLRLGSYLLLQQLGSGGMSSVFRAVHEETGNIVAVKVLPTELAKNVTLLQRFLREAKSAEALDHPNIVAIYDRGFDRGRHYLVLEYVEGGDLHDRVRNEGPLSIADAMRVIRQTAEGLRYAAGLNMIHRDIKPANLLLAPDGNTKIIDLGLALHLSDEDERVTRDGTTVGTVDYMAPEQARDSRKTSVRSDIYSLGCTLHYLLTGRPPYPGGNLADKLTRHVTAPVPDPCLIRPEIPEPISRLARRMMAKKPEDRFEDHDQLLRALRHATADPGPTIVLDALIADDDEPLGPPESASGEAASGRGYTLAELVEFEDEAPRPVARREEVATAIPVLSMAELAALEDDQTAQRAVRSQPIPRPSLADILDEEVAPATFTPAMRRSGDELPLKTWIAAGVMVGLAVALLGIIASLLISTFVVPRTTEVIARPSESADPTVTPIPEPGNGVEVRRAPGNAGAHSNRRGPEFRKPEDQRPGQGGLVAGLSFGHMTEKAESPGRSVVVGLIEVG